MNELIESEIEKELKKENIYILEYRKTMIYTIILYIKYLCDKKKSGFSYEEIIKDKNINKTLEKLKDDINPSIYRYMENTELNKTLRIIEYENLKDLITNFIKSEQTNEILFNSFKNENDKVLFYGLDEEFYNYDLNTASASIVKEKISKTTHHNYFFFKLIDKMLGVKRKYYDNIKDIDLKEYNIIIINDESPVYKFSRTDKNIIDDIIDLFRSPNNFKGKVILKVQYRKISILTRAFILRDYLSKVVFFSDTKNPYVIMEFEEGEKSNISLIMLDEKLEKNIEETKKIIKNNRVKKNTLIKVKPDDIIENNYRIGFKMYALDNKTEVKKINEIIDENSRLISRMDRINKEIENEVNKLIVK